MIYLAKFGSNAREQTPLFAYTKGKEGNESKN
jgi:hypothetical protein